MSCCGQHRSRREIIAVSQVMDFWWPRLSALGGGFWIATIGAGISGLLLARSLLRPGLEARGSRQAQQIGLWRSVAGFGFVLGVSWSYRAPEDTADNALGTFNMTMGVAVVVALVPLALMWLSPGGRHDVFRPRASEVLSRIGGAALGFGALLGIMWLIGHSGDHAPRSVLIALAGAFVGAGVFYAAACWYISRFWFGLNAVHPLLGSFVTAVTISVMTAYTLLEEGPKSLPVPSWLMVTVGAAVTTLGICVWDVAEHWRPGSRAWPPAIAAVVAVLLAGAAVFIAHGGAQRILCTAASPVNCDRDTSDQPSRVAPKAAAFQLANHAGLDLNADPPTLTIDRAAADLIFADAVYAGDRATITAWTEPGDPDRDRCDLLLRARAGTRTSYRPAAGTWLCVATSQGRLAGVRVTSMDGSSLIGSATLWW